MEYPRPLHIAVAGNIGAGKTTLVTKLAKHYQWTPHFEAVDNNPYLEDFYGDMTKYSFPLQIYFLHSRFNQVREIRNCGYSVIQDRTIYEDAHIFARNLHDSDLMTARDYKNYLSLFDTMGAMIQPPDLLIYLRARVPVLVERIAKRGRDYEESLNIKYLEDLNELYEDWIRNYENGKLLVIDVNDLDYADRPEDLYKVITKVDAELHGLFSQEYQ